MAQIVADGNPNRILNAADDFTPQGETATLSADLALVVGSASKSESWLSSKQWNLLWRDADILYQSPRPMSVYENTYILEPNVQRFTLAKVINSIVPKLYKGLFYDNPPMVLRPRPGTSQNITDAKTALFATLLDECGFKSETKIGLEEMALLGTSIWKWGIEYKKIVTPKRKPSAKRIPSKYKSDMVYVDEMPEIEFEERIAPRPFFEHRFISQVYVDMHTQIGDIQASKYAIDVQYMDWYELEELRKNTEAAGEEGWHWPPSLKALWEPPMEAQGAVPINTAEQLSKVIGIVHHAEEPQIGTSSDPLRRPLEVLEYWDKERKVLVLNRRKVIFSGKNPFNKIPFFSANWWNRPKAFYGLGLGMIIGQNQRVDQGTINAILKMLAFGVNPVYLRNRASNAPTQMIRTAIGKIVTVDGEPAKAFQLLETPKVPTEVWTALRESQEATESSSGADQMLVQGSSAGPRTSMGRTAPGANILAASSADRLDGPLDNFIDQVFKPFLWQLDELVFRYMSDVEIMTILGKELGKDIEVDMQKFHQAVYTFEVLAGASLSAKRTMAQSITLITQMFNNPMIQQNLAEINEEYIDFKPILNMWMEASEWKNRQDIIKPLTNDMKERQRAKSQAAQAQSKFAQQLQLNDQKFGQKQEIDDQATDGRIKRDLVREAARNSSMTEALTGEPSPTGLGGAEPEVE